MIEKLVRLLEAIRDMLTSHKSNAKETAALRAKLLEKEVILKKMAAIELELEETISLLTKERSDAIELIGDIESELRKF